MAAAVTYLAYMLRWVSLGGFGRRDQRDGGPLFLLLISFLAPIAALIIQMWISRTREYAADEHGARIAGNPLSLANALRKLELAAHRVPMAADPATAHMF